MSAEPVSLEPPQAGTISATRVASLGEALRTERRLLDELARVLKRQREGGSTHDLELLDDSVYAAQRIFHTLHEARVQRRILLQLMEAPDDTSLADVESVLGEWASEDLVQARDDLMMSARALAREVDMNRHILNGAMELGDQLIRAFAGGAEPAPAYTSEDVPETGGSAGSFLNTRV